MKIIDAHLHLGDETYFDEIAQNAGHINSIEHLRGEYARLNIEQGIIMGNLPVENTSPVYPDFLSYCVGLDSLQGFSLNGIQKRLHAIEAHLQRDNCVGIKLYPGYAYFYIYDDAMTPIYKLAAKYKKPVAVHTGLTAGSNALLKYSHPMVMDEVATKFPQVQFIMCHFGEPWFEDAAAVMEKNPNVAADLSGILEGKIVDFPAFLSKKHFYIERMQGWLEYLDSYERFMFGTDWPLANLEDYIEFTKVIIPEEHWAKVFYDNALRIYQLKAK